MNFLSLGFCPRYLFQTTWVCWSVIWLALIVTLWVFAFFYRFHISSPRASSGFVCRAFLRCFDLFVVQSTLYLLPYTCLVVVNHFVALFGWLALSSLEFRFVSFEPRSHGSLLSLGSFFVLWMFGLWFQELNVLVLDRICLCYFSKLFSAFYHHRKEKSLLLWIS